MFELYLDENNRVIGTQNTEIAYHGGITVDEVPKNELDYIFADGEFVYDPLPHELPAYISDIDENIWSPEQYGWTKE